MYFWQKYIFYYLKYQVSGEGSKKKERNKGLNFLFVYYRQNKYEQKNQVMEVETQCLNLFP